MKVDLIKSILSLLVLLLCCCFCKGSEHARCDRTYEKIYCFKRNPPHSGVRLFNTLVMTDNDWGASQYSGQGVDWKNWADYMHGFMCRCLQRLEQLAKKNGKKYHHISVVNHGECWTSEDIIYDLTKLDMDDTCVGADFKSCHREAESECFGADYSQYVYHINYDDEPVEEEFEFLNSECTIETLTVCSSPSTLYASSTVQP